MGWKMSVNPREFPEIASEISLQYRIGREIKYKFNYRLTHDAKGEILAENRENFALGVATQTHYGVKNQCQLAFFGA